MSDLVAGRADKNILKNRSKYMQEVSQRVANMAESETIVMSQKSRELQAKGIDVINLSVGEPDFSTPNHIKEAAKRAIDENYTYYTPVPGYLKLRTLIADKLLTENGLAYNTDQIVVTNGAKQAIYNAILSVVNPGDEVIVPAPYWVSYLEIIKLAGGKPVIVNTTLSENYKITPGQLKSAITSKTRVLFLNSPSNPSGSVYSKDELKSIAEVLLEYPQILVLSDEIYEHIIYDGEHVSIAIFPELKERVMVVNGVSKGYAMTGWRIGYVAAAVWIAQACNKLQSQQTSGACAIAQMAAVAAYEGGLASTIEMREAFQRRRNLMVKLALEMDGVKVNTPPGAFYLFPDVSAFFGKCYENSVIRNADDLSIYLLEKANVACVSGNAFGSPNNLRISYAASDEKLIEAMRRIKIAFNNLR